MSSDIYGDAGKDIISSTEEIFSTMMQMELIVKKND